MNGCLRVVAAFLAAAPLLHGQTPAAELLRQADVAYRAKDIPEAVRLFERTLEADPSLTPAHMMLGIIYAQQDQAARAAVHFESAVRAQPDNAAAHLYLARVSGVQSNWDKAAAHYRAALANGHPDRDSATIGLAVAEVHIGEPSAARARLNALGEPKDQRNVAARHAALALVDRHLDNPRSAAGSLRKAIAADPLNPALAEQLIEALIAAGEYAESLTEAIQAQRKFPGHAGIQYRLGIGGFYIAGSPFTRLALRNLRELELEDPRILVLDGLVRIRNGELGAATGVLREAVAARVPQGRLFLALALAERAEYGEAEELLRQDSEEITDGNFHLALAGVLIAQARYAEALPPLLKAEACMPRQPEVHLRLSRVYERAGDTAKANRHKKAWEQLRAEVEAAN